MVVLDLSWIVGPRLPRCFKLALRKANLATWRRGKWLREKATQSYERREEETLGCTGRGSTTFPLALGSEGTPLLGEIGIFGKVENTCACYQIAYPRKAKYPFKN